MTTFEQSIPVLPTTNLQASIRFYCDHLGFQQVHVTDGEYGIVQRDRMQLHFWCTKDPELEKVSSCRIRVSGIQDLYREMEGKGFVHPKGKIDTKTWGTTEFAIVDPSGVLIWFFE